jgi:hypothetical protein
VEALPFCSYSFPEVRNFSSALRLSGYIVKAIETSTDTNNCFNYCKHCEVQMKIHAGPSGREVISLQKVDSYC